MLSDAFVEPARHVSVFLPGSWIQGIRACAVHRDRVFGSSISSVGGPCVPGASNVQSMNLLFEGRKFAISAVTTLPTLAVEAVRTLSPGSAAEPGPVAAVNDTATKAAARRKDVRDLAAFAMVQPPGGMRSPGGPTRKGLIRRRSMPRTKLTASHHCISKR